MLKYNIRSLDLAPFPNHMYSMGCRNKEVIVHVVLRQWNHSCEQRQVNSHHLL